MDGGVDGGVEVGVIGEKKGSGVTTTAMLGRDVEEDVEEEEEEEVAVEEGARMCVSLSTVCAEGASAAIPIPTPTLPSAPGGCMNLLDPLFTE